MSRPATVVLSTSTWQQPMPPSGSRQRAGVVAEVAGLIEAHGAHRLRIGIDGRTAAGKTTIGHEIARELARRGRTTLRATLDDFKRPWSEAHRYDRRTGAGYYRNAFDHAAVRRLLLEPCDPQGDGRAVLCSIDPITQNDHSAVTVLMPGDGVLVVDGVFAFRPEINAFWDLRLWVDIGADLALARGVRRDTELEGGALAAETLHRDRYLAAEQIYMDEVDPVALADVVIDNRDFDRPRLLRRAAGA